MDICAEHTHFNSEMKASLDNCARFADTITHMTSIMNTLKIYRMVRDHNAMMMQSAAMVRSQLNKCHPDGPDAPYIKGVAPFVLKMLDNLALLYDLSMKYSHLYLVRKSTRTVFEIWNDLLDDCTVFQDHEIRAGLNRLADESKALNPSGDWRKELYGM